MMIHQEGIGIWEWGRGDGGEVGVGVGGYLVLTIKSRVAATSFDPQIRVSRGTWG
jgi:hypothetical protein